MRYLIPLVLAALFLGLPAFAQSDAIMSWQASDGATGYKLYVGTAPRTYDLVSGQDTGSDLTLAVSGLPRDCSTLYTAATAYNAFGESPYSGETIFHSRPAITQMAPTSSGSTVWVIDGTSFALGVQLLINGVVVQSLVRDNCTTLSFQSVEIPGASEWTDVTLCNGTVCTSMTPQKPDAPGTAPAVS